MLLVGSNLLYECYNHSLHSAEDPYLGMCMCSSPTSFNWTTVFVWHKFWVRVMPTRVPTPFTCRCATPVCNGDTRPLLQVNSGGWNSSAQWWHQTPPAGEGGWNSRVTKTWKSMYVTELMLFNLTSLANAAIQYLQWNLILWSNNLLECLWIQLALSLFFCNNDVK